MSRSSTTRRRHAGRVFRAGPRLVPIHRRRRRRGHHRQRGELPVQDLRRPARPTRHRPHLHQAVPAPNQRQSRAVQPHPRRRVLLQLQVQIRARPPTPTPNLGPPLQSPPPPHRYRRHTRLTSAQPLWVLQQVQRGGHHGESPCFWSASLPPEGTTGQRLPTNATSMVPAIRNNGKQLWYVRVRASRIPHEANPLPYTYWNLVCQPIPTTHSLELHIGRDEPRLRSRRTSIQTRQAPVAVAGFIRSEAKTPFKSPPPNRRHPNFLLLLGPLGGVGTGLLG